MRALIAAVVVATAGCHLHATRKVWDTSDPPPTLLADGTAVVGTGGHVERRTIAPPHRVLWTSKAIAGDSLVAAGSNVLYEVAPGLIQRVDLTTGAVLGTASYPGGINMRFVRGGDALYSNDSMTIARVDVATGAVIWKLPNESSTDDVIPTPTGMWTNCTGGLCGHAAADGAVFGDVVPPTSWPRVTPHGDLIAIALDRSIALYASATGKLVRTIELPKPARIDRIVVGDRYVAANARDVIGKREGVLVFRIADGALVTQQVAREGAYTAYLGMSDEVVAYFDSGDASVYAIALPEGTRRFVDQLSEGFVLSTDHSGVTPAIPSADLFVAGDVVFVTYMSGIMGYRIAR